MKKIRIFLASPSDVSPERSKFEAVIVSLKPIADYLNLIIEIVDWRHVVPAAGRPQQIIFDQLRPNSWDIFVGILWHRFGTPSGAINPISNQEYSSGTEEEFYEAYRLWEEHNKPRIIVYKSNKPITFDVDFTQAQKVKDFFAKIQAATGEFRVLTQSFENLETFEKLVLNNFQKILIEHSENSNIELTPEVTKVLEPINPNNLPRATSFFGREKEIEAVMRALSPDDRTWGVLIDGIGGIGKTSIAIEAAHQAQQNNLFDIFIYITAKINILNPIGIKELDPQINSIDEFLNETARILGDKSIIKLHTNEKRKALINCFANKKILLIYDNLESISREEQEAMADFLRELPIGSKAIITSRRRGGEGAVWLRVDKLDPTAAYKIIENELEKNYLLQEKLSKLKDRWDELYDETKGSPLALMHILGLLRVRASLTFNKAVKMLRGNKNDDLQQFIFAEARKEFSTNDVIALSALSVFESSASFEMWAGVSGLSRNALESCIDRLNALSLVDLLSGKERYTLHPLTKGYVKSNLIIDKENATNLHINFCIQLSTYVVKYGGAFENYSTYDKLEEEWSNISFAINWLINVSENLDDVAQDKIVRIANRLFDNVHKFLLYNGRWDDFVSMSRGVYNLNVKFDNLTAAGWYAYRTAWIYLPQRDVINSEIWAAKCKDAWKLDMNDKKRATINSLYANIADTKGDFETAKEAYENCLILYKKMGDKNGISITLKQLGSIARINRDYKLANHYLLESLSIARQNKDIDGEAVCIITLGNLERDFCNWNTAKKWYEEGLGLSKKLNAIEYLAYSEFGLAYVIAAEGQFDSSLILAKEALIKFELLKHHNFSIVQEFVLNLEKKISS